MSYGAVPVAIIYLQ